MEELKQLLKSLTGRLESLIGELSQEEISEIREVISLATAKIAQGVRPSMPKGAEFLYVLAGGNPAAFKSYAKEFPDPAINKMAQDPRQLNNILQQLQQTITFPTGQVKDGIPKAQLNSSNVYGFQYDPRRQLLRVRFNEGGVYEYDQVPQQIFKLFAQGAIPAKTNGRNKWGFWFVGKKPSLGASMFQLIKNGGYNYRKLA